MELPSPKASPFAEQRSRLGTGLSGEAICLTRGLHEALPTIPR